MEVNSDDEDDSGTNRYDDAELRRIQEFNDRRVLVQSVEEARAWDRRREVERAAMASMASDTTELGTITTLAQYPQQTTLAIAPAPLESDRIYIQDAFAEGSLGAAAVAHEQQRLVQPKARPRRAPTTASTATPAVSAANDLSEPEAERTITREGEVQSGVFGDADHFVVSGDINAPELFDYDWVDHESTRPQNLTGREPLEIWRWFNEKRYRLIREVLMRGQSVQLRSSGNSLVPIIYPNDITFIRPILPGCNSQIKAGDVIFCLVQPNDRWYIHLVWRIGKWRDEYGIEKDIFVIGNNKKGFQRRCNGWCYREHVFGIVWKTQRGPIDPALSEPEEEDTASASGAATAPPGLNLQPYEQPPEGDRAEFYGSPRRGDGSGYGYSAVEPSPRTSEDPFWDSAAARQLQQRGSEDPEP